MSRPEGACRLLAGTVVLVLLAGCDQLGNPKQYATGPTPWKDQRGHLVTTTRSFKSEKTIRRVLAEDLEDLDYTDPSIGPSQTLTLVAVVPRALRPRRNRRRHVKLVTIFKLPDGPSVTRHWNASLDSEKWTAAFALPDAPIGAVSSVAP